MCNKVKSKKRSVKQVAYFPTDVVQFGKLQKKSRFMAKTKGKEAFL